MRMSKNRRLIRVSKRDQSGLATRINKVDASDIGRQMTGSESEEVRKISSYPVLSPPTLVDEAHLNLSTTPADVNVGAQTSSSPDNH